MTLEEAFLYMFKSLNNYWEETHNDELGRLLSDLNPHLFPGTDKKQISTADPAAWYDWVEAVGKLMPANLIAEAELIKAKKAHSELFDWLDTGRKLLANNEITKEELVKRTKAHDDQPAWDDWAEAVRKTLPNERITEEQAKIALVLLMREYNNQGFDLTQIMNKMEYIFQRGLPESLKEKAHITRGELTTFAWEFEHAKKLLEWVSFNDYIIRGIQTFYVTKTVQEHRYRTGVEYSGDSWDFQADKTKSREENKKSNRFSASKFIEIIHTKKEDMLFEILFESDKTWDQIKIEFFTSSIIRGGETLYSAEDGLNIIDRCREFEKKIIAIEAFRLEGKTIQPMDYTADYTSKSYEDFDPVKYFEMHHVKKNGDIGHWEEAKHFIKERVSKGWVFEIDYEE